jgi:hypothetical protein
MADASLYLDATLRDRFVAAVSRDDENIAQRLARLAPGSETLEAQRDEAWVLLTAASHWAALALESVGIQEINDSPVHDSDTAFERAQHLDELLWKLSQQPNSSDGVALVVERVKQACYLGADLGPLVGGLISSRGTASQVEPDPADLQAIGSDTGDALRRLGELHLADPIEEVQHLKLERRTANNLDEAVGDQQPTRGKTSEPFASES